MIDPGTRRLYLAAVLLLVAFYGIVGFYPFKFAPLSSGQLDNGAESTPGTGLHFHSPGIAHTPAAPVWLQQAIAIPDFKLSLQVRAADPDQYGPARIFTLSANPYLRNFTVGQHGSSLSIRLRTRQTTLNGTPDYWIKGVFAEPGWRRIDIRITGETLEIYVDEDLLVTGLLPYRALESWDSSYRIALGNELTGNRSWQGEIRKAVVGVGDQAYDYLAPGALLIPEKFSVSTAEALHSAPFARYQFNNATILDWTINLLGFVPFGWLVGMLRRPRPGILSATLLAAAISATIETSQLLFLVDRFPSIVDFIFNTLGGFVGAWIAMHFDLSVRRRPTAESSK